MTNYQVVYDKFLDKIIKDSDFFMFGNLSKEEIKDIVQTRLSRLLSTSINYLYLKCTPDIDFYKKDDKKECFNVDLTPIETDLLADIMKYKYAEEDQMKLKVMENYVGDDLKVFSPANERKTFNYMLTNIKNNVDISINEYISKDRKTNKYKMPTYNINFEI